MYPAGLHGMWAPRSNHVHCGTVTDIISSFVSFPCACVLVPIGIVVLSINLVNEIIKTTQYAVKLPGMDMEQVSQVDGLEVVTDPDGDPDMTSWIGGHKCSVEAKSFPPHQHRVAHRESQSVSCGGTANEKTSHIPWTSKPTVTSCD